MNIVSVKNNPGQHDYDLQEQNKTVLKLRYKDDMHTARVETDNERRVLIIEDEGLLKSRFVLKNEYGVRIGSLNYDNFSDTHGTVEIENSKYRFSIKQNDHPELYIYKGSRRNLIYSCRLVHDEHNKKETRSQSAAFTIALTWYLFLKGVVQGQHAFHEAIIL